MKWEHRIKSIDNKTKVTFSFDIDEKKWKKVELESLQRILNTNFKNDKGKYIYFFMPIVESFYSLKENREYLFSIKSSDKPDLLIESEFGVIGVEFTTSSSTERKKGGTETRRMPDIQKKQLKELLKDKDSFATDSVPHKYIKNDHENLMQAMVKRIEKKMKKVIMSTI